MYLAIPVTLGQESLPHQWGEVEVNKTQGIDELNYGTSKSQKAIQSLKIL